MINRYLARYLSLFLFLLFVPCLRAEENFEGELAFTMLVNGRATNMSYFMKDLRMRMEIDTGNGVESVGLADYEKKKIAMLVPRAKIYNEMRLDEDAFSGKAEKELQAAEIEETGESEDILGYNCSKILSRRGAETTEIWIAKNFATFYKSDLNMQNPTLRALQDRFQKEKAFPFRIVTYDPAQKELFRMEVTKVEKKPLDEDLFKIPSDYRNYRKAPAGAGAQTK